MSRKILSIFRLLILTALTLVGGTMVMAQQRPLITEDIEIVSPGSIRFELGLDFQQDVNFPLAGLNGDLSRLGVVSLTMGLAPNVEVEYGGVIQNFLSINRQYRPSAIPLRLTPATNSTRGVGDFYMATKIKMRAETKRMPAIGSRFGVEMPNSDQSRGIGVNQINLFSTIIAGKTFGRLRVYGNVGLGIYTAPLEPFTQNDMFLYGLAATYRWSDRLTLAGELQGRANTRRNIPRGTESDGAARIGARIRAAGLTWDVAGMRGLNRDSARTGISVGISYETFLLHPAK
ncbi:MAG: hypothetical protein ACK562_13835 [Acidobacteriota bacterium]|jgi:hypothetical protein